MLARSLKTRIQREGFWPAIRDVVGTLRPIRFEVWKLSREKLARRTSIDSDTNVLVGAAAIESLKQLRGATPGLPIEFYRDEIDSMHSCYTALVDGRLAAIAWSYDQMRPAHFLRMSPSDAEIRSVYSLSEFRGRGLAKAVIFAACASLFSSGVQDIYAVIYFRNEASRAAFRSIGFSRLAELKRPAILGPRFITTTGGFESWLEAVSRTLRSL